MTLRSYLILMSMLTAVSWISFLYVLLAIDPYYTNWLGFSLFYFSLFISLIGTASIVGFVARFAVLKKNLAFRSVSEAFRQSFLFAILVVAILYLLSRQLFSWTNGFLLASALAVLEFFMASYSRR